MSNAKVFNANFEGIRICRMGPCTYCSRGRNLGPWRKARSLARIALTLRLVRSLLPPIVRYTASCLLFSLSLSLLGIAQLRHWRKGAQKAAPKTSERESERAKTKMHCIRWKERFTRYFYQRAHSATADLYEPFCRPVGGTGEKVIFTVLKSQNFIGRNVATTGSMSRLLKILSPGLPVVENFVNS